MAKKIEILIVVKTLESLFDPSTPRSREDMCMLYIDHVVPSPKSRVKQPF